MTDTTDRPIAPPFLSAFLAMHAAMRRDLAVLPEAIEIAVARGEVEPLRRWFGFVRSTIEHHHHHLEDDALWPELDRRLPGFLAQTAVLSDDHHRLDDAFDGVDHALARLQEASDIDATGATVRAANVLHKVLTDHLEQEERTVLGPIGDAFTAEEYDEFEREAAKGTPFRLFAFGLPWLLDGVEPATQRAVLDPMPPVARLLFRPFQWWYRRVAAPVRDVRPPTTRMVA